MNQKSKSAADIYERHLTPDAKVRGNGHVDIYEETTAAAADDEISLIDIIRVLWQQKIIICTATIAVACIVGMVTLPKVLFGQKALTKMKFKLNFAGADKGQYPNGMAFSANEITAPIILEKVYNKNNLGQYNLEQHQFRDMLTVAKADDGLNFLEEKYTGLLSDKKLSPEERQKLQDEYQTQKAKLLNNTQYFITFHDDQMQVPKEAQGKVLGDVLKEWATFTEHHKGVYLYQVPVLTEDLFDFDDDNEEYIVRVDMLRQMAQRVSGNIEEVAALPGAMQARTEKGTSISSLQVRMMDLIRYKIDSLSGLIRSGFLYHNETFAKIYINEQIYNLTLTEKTQKGELALTKDSLDGYINSDENMVAAGQQNSSQRSLASTGTLIPQIGDNFLDRLVSLANESQDTKYRQDITQRIVTKGGELLTTEREITFYTDLLPDSSRRSGVSKEEQAQISSYFSKKYETAILESKEITAEMNALYQAISINTLRPEQTLYSSTNVPQYTKASVHSIKKAGVASGGVVFLFFGLMCMIALIREQLSIRRG